MTPEQKARVSIDALLVTGGWCVCSVAPPKIQVSNFVAYFVNCSPITSFYRPTQSRAACLLNLTAASLTSEVEAEVYAKTPARTATLSTE